MSKQLKKQVEAQEVKKLNSFIPPKLLSILTGFILPIFFAAIILFSSGYAKVTTRQGSFNSTIIIIIAVLAVALVAIVILKVPLESYKKLLHPIKNKFFKIFLNCFYNFF